MCGMPKPSYQAPPPVITPPQLERAPEKMPDQETFKRKNVKNARSSINSGNSGTILTGPSGDVVPQSQLGTSTLLGG